MAESLNGSEYLSALVLSRRTMLTIGLDTDILRIPATLGTDVLRFNREIIDATQDLCIAYKINFAFYESLGTKGWNIMEETIAHIPSGHLIIADAKRGDIGNTSEMYARAVYDTLGCDAITVSPYMGEDSVKPFYRAGKWVIILALTSNKGSADFQKQSLSGGKLLYEEVMDRTSHWGSAQDTMYVVGATHPQELQKIRTRFPEHFFLVPGVGAQGGNIDEICTAGMNATGGLLINASRSILYAGNGVDFAEQARKEAERLTVSMSRYIGTIMN